MERKYKKSPRNATPLCGIAEDIASHIRRMHGITIFDSHSSLFLSLDTFLRLIDDAAVFSLFNSRATESVLSLRAAAAATAAGASCLTPC